MLPASPGPACARSPSACDVPSPGDVTRRSDLTVLRTRCRIPARSMRRSHGSSVGGHQWSTPSAPPAAPPSVGKHILRSRNSPGPRSHPLDTVGARSGSCRRPGTAPSPPPHSSCLRPTAAAHWLDAPNGAPPSRPASARSGLVAIRYPGSPVGSFGQQNPDLTLWQAIRSGSRRLGVYHRNNELQTLLFPPFRHTKELCSLHFARREHSIRKRCANRLRSV